jgi:hypothetical protein
VAEILPLLLSSGAGFANVETRLFGLLAAAFKPFELLLGLGCSQQRQRFGIADGAGKAFGLGQIQLVPGRVELAAAAVAVSGFTSK